MRIITTVSNSSGIKISALDSDNREIGRAFLYILYNDLHKELFGLMEDVYVEDESRGQGIGTQLIKKVIKLAHENNCYKLIATSRYSREKVHKLYTSLGFVDYGKELRLDL